MNTFVDSKKKISEIDSALDFITVRNSGGRLVFMGARKNVKCFDRLKKVSERVFETIQGQTYKFLDKMPEPAAKIEITPEMLERAEASWLAHCMARDAGMRAAASTPEPQKPMTFEEQLAHAWRFNPDIRKEFTSFESYQAYMRAAKSGRCSVYGCKS